MAFDRTNRVRALGLCSGGLDSILSAVLLLSQKIDIHWIAFETPFFSSQKAKNAAKENNIPLSVKDITNSYLKMMKDPQCKFGKNMNPCMDCHSLMFKQAGKIMVENGFDFMFSGEVLGQRPMSQNKCSLRYVEKKSGYAGYILRPLSAKKLPLTKPEIERLVDRNLLLDISGRSRKEQIHLAKKWGIINYPSPAGGCLLTDNNFCKRLRDLFEHQKTYPNYRLQLLKIGRHMRLDEKTKMIIGRNYLENQKLKKYSNFENDIVLETCYVPGPVVVVFGGCVRKNIILAASICAGYSKARRSRLVVVRAIYGTKYKRETECIEVMPLYPFQSNYLLI